MEVTDVRQQIMAKQLDSFYVFAGDELELIWTYVRKIAETAGKKLRYEDDYAKVVKSSRTPSIIKQSYVYVLRDDQSLLKDEKLWTSVSETRDNILILLLSSVDKRTKFYKTFKDRLVEFQPMSENVLAKRVHADVDMSETHVNRLISLCECNYGRILLELDKIKRFSKIERCTPDECFERFLEDGFLYEPPRDMIFELAKQFLLRRPVPTFQLYQECLEGGEAVLVMLSVIYNNVRQLLQLETCRSKDVAKSTGLTSWQIRNANEVRGFYAPRELVQILKTIQRVEEGIKTGQIEESVAMPYFLATVM